MLPINEFAKDNDIEVSQVHKLINTHKVKKQLKGHIHYIRGQMYLDAFAINVLGKLIPKPEKKEEKKKMTEKEILVRNIENYRISHKLTKLELSKKLGLGTSRITNLENVESDTPSWKLLERLSKLMNKSFSELFTLDKEQFGIKEEPEDNQFYSKLLEAKNNEIEGLRKQLDQKTDDAALKVVVNRTSQECTLYKGGKKSDVQVIRLIPERGRVHIDVPINSVEWVG